MLPLIPAHDDRLKKPCDPVTVFDESLKALTQDMAHTMYAEGGIGLAAPQVGVLKAVLLIDLDGNLRVLVNPVLLEAEGEQVGPEGCLSYPGLTLPRVLRFYRIRVRYQDIKGGFHERVSVGLEARCIQHELDHLSGKVFLDPSIQAPPPKRNPLP